MAWTESQRKAIEIRDKNLLVAAAAGSGKTAVLVERIIRQVLDGEWDVDRLLVVTFTHAAAEEMRIRIEAALREKLEQEEDEGQQERLERQLILLSGAAISTLHSFCQDLIRQNFSALDLDPEFRIGGEQELRLMQQDVLEELFEAEYERGEKGFLEFADVLGGDERGDEKLHELVLRLYHYSMSQPFPGDWLRSLPAALRLSEGAGLRDTPWYESIRRELRMGLEGALEEARRALDALGMLGAEAYEKTAAADTALLESLLEALESEDWEGLRRAFSSATFERLGRMSKEDADRKEAADLALKGPREHYKKVVADFQKKYFQETEGELAEDMAMAAGDMEVLCSLTEKFGAAFSAAKHQKSVVDFNDLEHYALELLCERKEGELCPSDIAEALQQRFRAVMVDEYQDTNGVQEAILSMVASGERPSLFCVGDVKQSIYRFRLAAPELFLRKYREYPKMGEDYARIDLARNFRSRAGVLSAINFIFAQVMSGDAMELEYDDAAALHPGMEYPPCPGRSLGEAAELDILFDEGKDEKEGEPEGEAEGDETESPKGLEREARWIALRLKQLMGEGRPVFDKERKEYRPLRWRDMVILLRSVKGKADKMLDVLRQHGIPAYAAVDTGYFEEQEIRVMLALLSVVQNARQDIPLAAVLASPIVGMEYEELAKIRLAAEEEDLYGALLAAASPEAGTEARVQEKAALFLERLSRWRRLSRELSVPELIRQLYRDTGYYDYAGGLPGGLLRQANLRMLIDRAAEYEATDFRGLFRFLGFVKRMQDTSTDLSVARTLGEKEDVVRIMSVHKSKGLEFPVVVLADLGKKFNLQDARAELLMHRELGLGPYRVDREGSFRYPTFARRAIAAKILQENKAEELRVLYVAMTRAREQLILVGTVSNEKQWKERLLRWASGEATVRLPAHVSFGADSFLDWVVMAVARHPEGKALRERAGLEGEPKPFLDYRDDSRWKVTLAGASDVELREGEPVEEDGILAAVERGEPLPDSPKRDAVRRILDWKYDMRGLGRVSSKLSVTEIKRRFAERDREMEYLREPSREWKRPEFLQERHGITGVEYGTLMHSILQHMDPEKSTSFAGVKKQLEALAEEEILLPEQVERIRIKNVQAFFVSPLGRRLGKAKKAWREISFSRMLPANRFYREAEPGEELFVQGIIDLLFEEEGGGLILVDYKTDQDTAPERVREAYRIQMELYGQAVAEILKRPVEEQYLYMLHDGSIVKMEE